MVDHNKRMVTNIIFVEIYHQLIKLLTWVSIKLRLKNIVVDIQYLKILIEPNVDFFANKVQSYRWVLSNKSQKQLYFKETKDNFSFFYLSYKSKAVVEKWHVLHRKV